VDFPPSDLLKKARELLNHGEAEKALEWLELVPPGNRPPDLTAAAYYEAAKEAAAREAWGHCESYLAAASKAEFHPLYQKRLELTRRRAQLQDAAVTKNIADLVDPPERLSIGALAPEVERAWACGAYYARSRAGAPWSRLLRRSKGSVATDAEDDVRLSIELSAGYLVRYVLSSTDALRHADVVVDVPTSPERYSERMHSLPADLAEAISQQLGIPWERDALVRRTDVELKRMSRTERRRHAIRTMEVERIGLCQGRCVLVVDDVITSGSTMKAAAAHLRSAGASNVIGMALCHTEG